MRLLGVRKSSAALVFGLLAAGLGVLGAGSSGPGSARYEVSAQLLSVKGGPVYACHIILLSYPPAGCGGVLVRAVDIAGIGGVVRYRDGTRETPVLRLVGAGMATP